MLFSVPDQCCQNSENMSGVFQCFTLNLESCECLLSASSHHQTRLFLKREVLFFFVCMRADAVRRENTWSNMNKEQWSHQPYEEPDDRVDLRGFIDKFLSMWPSKPKQESRDKDNGRSFFRKFIDMLQRKKNQKSIKNDDELSFFGKFMEVTHRSSTYRPSAAFFPLAAVAALILGSICFILNIWKMYRGAR